MSWLWPVGFGFVASTAALVGSGLILAIGERAERAAAWLLSYAIGTLLGAAAFGLLPEALEQAPADRTMLYFLCGMVGFIVFERLLRFRHHHEPHHGGHAPVEKATAAMILWGDALHNFVDGLVLGVSFRVSPEVGIGVSLAIVAHEIPQEIGDFAVLLGSGMSRRRAFLLNYVAALTPVAGALVSYWWAGATGIAPTLLPIAAGGFVYIALADLVPSLHHRRGARAGAAQIALIFLGLLTMWGLRGLHGPE